MRLLSSKCTTLAGLMAVTLPTSRSRPWATILRYAVVLACTWHPWLLFAKFKMHGCHYPLAGDYGASPWSKHSRSRNQLNHDGSSSGNGERHVHSHSAMFDRSVISLSVERFGTPLTFHISRWRENSMLLLGLHLYTAMHRDCSGNFLV